MTEEKEKGKPAGEQQKPEKKQKGEKKEAQKPEGEKPAGEKKPKVKEVIPEARLFNLYKSDVIPGMIKKFQYKNIMQVPKLTKIVLNMGIGEASRDIKELDIAMEELGLISGQKPKLTRSAKAISAFKIRQGMPVGCFVTLRGKKMYEFLDHLINIAIPRIRDFRGLSAKTFDGRGNLSFGIKEHLMFVELDFNKVPKVRGMNVTIVSTAKTDDECKELLRLFGMPFRREDL